MTDSFSYPGSLNPSTSIAFTSPAFPHKATDFRRGGDSTIFGGIPGRSSGEHGKSHSYLASSGQDAS
jgi:hypothetical protein